MIMWFMTRSAKERKVRIWKDYVAPTANLDQKDRQFVAKVRPFITQLVSLFNVVLMPFFSP